MSAAMTFPYAPNKLVLKDTNAVNTWFVITSDGSGYTSLSALAAAGKKPFPALDPGLFLQTLTVRTEGAGGADGSAFYIALNQATQPASDVVGALISGSGQQFTFSGGLNNLWVRKTQSTDKLVLEGAY